MVCQQSMAIRIIEKLFFWFMLYGFAGWLYESLLCSLEQKRFVNRGFLNGPYCPIYGAGAMLSIIIFEKVDNPFALFLL